MITRQTIGGAIDLTGQVINGLRVTKVVSRVPLRYETECIKCGSKAVFTHVQLRQAESGAISGGAHCRLDNCYLLGTARKAEPPTPRPAHTEENKLRVIAPVTKPTPKPVPPPDPLLGDYNRFIAAQRHWGYELTGFSAFKTCKELQPDYFESMMFQVNMLEQDLKKKREAIELGERLERQWTDDFIEKYKIDIAVNQGGQ